MQDDQNNILVNKTDHSGFIVESRQHTEKERQILPNGGKNTNLRTFRLSAAN